MAESPLPTTHENVVIEIFSMYVMFPCLCLLVKSADSEYNTTDLNDRETEMISVSVCPMGNIYSGEKVLETIRIDECRVKRSHHE